MQIIIVRYFLLLIIFYSLNYIYSIETFANLVSKKLGVNIDVLKKTLWGDYYIQSKTKRIMKGAQEKAKKPMFVQMILENIWLIYDVIINQKVNLNILKNIYKH